MNWMKHLAVILIFGLLIAVISVGTANSQAISRLLLDEIDDSTAVLSFGLYCIELRGPSDTLVLKPHMKVDSATHAVNADTADYANAAGAVNYFVPGKLTVTGVIEQYDIKHDLDTANIYCAHADTFARMPIDTNSIGAAEDSFQMMHPSVLYVPSGRWGYKYWNACTPPNAGSIKEDIHILVSNDEVTWTEFITDTGGVTCTLHNPVFAHDEFDSSIYTSDPDITWDEDSNLFIVFRVTRSINGQNINYLYSAATDNGVDWSDTVMMIDGYYNTGTEISPDTNSLALISPGVLMMGAEDYLMYTTEHTGSKYQRAAWEAPRIDTIWDNASGFDSTIKFGSAIVADTHRTSMVQQTLPNGGQVFHADEILYSSDLFVNLVGSYTGTAYPAIYMGLSTDGEYFTSVSTPLLDTTNNSTAWDHDIVYRLSGFFVERGIDILLRLYYCGADNDGDWYTGLTYVHFGDNKGKTGGMIWNPDLFTDTIQIFEVDSTIQGGIEIKSISVQTSVDGTYALKFFSYTAADPPVLHDYIDTLNVGASDQRVSSITFEDDDSPLVDRGQFIYMLTPSTDIDWMRWNIIYFERDP